MKNIYVVFMVTGLMNCHHLVAQTFELTYTTELQTDFRKGANWVNLLRSDFILPLGRKIEFECASVSVAKTRQERLANDLQVFSNIEAEGIPLAPAVLGIRIPMEQSSFFFGVRNLNEDYFVSSCTSLFTNSSCGIFPTISANYPIANYPVASMAIDYKLKFNHWTIESSLYNGTGYRNITGMNNVFRFCPDADGLLSIISVDYQRNGNGYFGGFVFYLEGDSEHKNGREFDEINVNKKNISTVLWGYIEQRVFRNVHLLLQYSVSPAAYLNCRNYVGVGMVFHKKQTVGGIFINHADFMDSYEWAGELTWKFPFSHKNGYVQPAIHLIRNNQERNILGLLRVGYVL